MNISVESLFYNNKPEEGEGELIKIKNNIHSTLDKFSKEQLKLVDNTVVTIKKMAELEKS
ncbi:MAG: hypothetical protein FWE02_06225 [Defluviitaleaceae bacterium]|nr:hypothetical protein [Defluviitaleaceae bacterium]